MFLVVVYTLLALVCLYFVARPLAKKKQPRVLGTSTVVGTTDRKTRG